MPSAPLALLHTARSSRRRQSDIPGEVRPNTVRLPAACPPPVRQTPTCPFHGSAAGVPFAVSGCQPTSAGAQRMFALLARAFVQVTLACGSQSRSRATATLASFIA